MDKVIKILLAIFRVLIIVIGLGTCAYIIANSNTDEGMVEGMASYGGALNLAYYTTLIVMVLCVFFALAFGIVYFILNIKKKMGMLIGIVAFLVIVAISMFVLGDPTITPDLVKLNDGDTSAVTPFISQASGGGLYLVYILGGLAMLAIVWTEVSSLVK
ncbi:MAG: hypothetical protein ACPGED_05325 [Flavobacteriales bacterium]